MATAYWTKGQKVDVLKGSASATSLIPTAISKAAPAVVTVASITGIAVGELIKIPDTSVAGASGFTELNGKTWVVGSITGSTFTLLGSDTSVSAGALAASPSFSRYAEAASMVNTCFSDITPNVEAPATISVATFCDPSATIPSAVVAPGTVDIAGYIDKSDVGFQELFKAYNDGVSRSWRVTMGSSQGYIVLEGVLSSFVPGMPIDGAYAYTGSITLGTKYRHLF